MHTNDSVRIEVDSRILLSLLIGYYNCLGFGYFPSDMLAEALRDIEVQVNRAVFMRHMVAACYF
jgi:hypothetical protein